MRALALLLATTAPAFAADRLPVPAVARTTDALEGEAKKCAAAHPRTDACFDIQMAHARALAADGRQREAADAAEAARLMLLDAMDPLDDAIAVPSFKLEKGTITPAERKQLAADKEALRMLWVETGHVALFVGDARRGADWGRNNARESYERAVSILETHGRGQRDLETRLRAAGEAAATEVNWKAVREDEAKLRAVIAEARTALPPDHRVTAGLLLLLANLVASGTAAADAEPVFREAQAMLGRLRAEPVARADADAAYARFLVARERRAEAETLHRDILARLDAARAPQTRIAEAYLDLSAAMAELPDALIFAQRALDIRTAALGERHYDTARAALRVADILEQGDQWQKAGDLRDRATIIVTTTLWRNSIGGATVELKLAESRLARGDVGAAAMYAGQTLGTFREKFGENHPSVARATMILGAARMRQGDARGRPLIDQAVAIYRATLPAIHSARIEAELGLAMTRLAVDRDLWGALRQLRIVAAAADERLRQYRDFNREAQREMRRFSPTHRLHVRVAWQLAQTKS